MQSAQYVTQSTLDLSQLLWDKENGDVKLFVRAHLNPNRRVTHKTIYAHAILLRHRSLFFASCLSKHSQSYSRQTRVDLTQLTVTSASLQLLLRYMYGGTIDWQEENLSITALLRIMEAARVLGLPQIFLNELQRYMIDERADELRLQFASVCSVVNTPPPKPPVECPKAGAKKNAKTFAPILAKYAFRKLREEFIYKVLADEPGIVFRCEDFHQLPQDLLVWMLEGKRLGLPEKRAWNRIMDWAITRVNIERRSHFQDLHSARAPLEGVSGWRTADYRRLASLLRPFLSHVRFEIMDDDDFLIKHFQNNTCISQDMLAMILRVHLESQVAALKEIGRSRSETSNSHVVLPELRVVAPDGSIYEDNDGIHEDNDGIHEDNDGIHEDNGSIHEDISSDAETVNDLDEVSLLSDTETMYAFDDEDLLKDLKGSLISNEKPVADEEINGLLATSEHAAYPARQPTDDDRDALRKVRNVYGKDNQQEFRLLYRGSRDGFSARAFHRATDGRFNTVTLVRPADNDDEILGGYTSAAWFSPVEPTYVHSVQSCLFRLSHASSDELVLSNICNASHAIEVNAKSGPSFGNGEFAVHFDEHGRAWGQCAHKTKLPAYEQAIGAGLANVFPVDEIEVYKTTAKGFFGCARK